jgi:hypothetical protein
MQRSTKNGSPTARLGDALLLGLALRLTDADGDVEALGLSD